VYIRSSFTVVKLHDLWSNYPRIVYGTLYRPIIYEFNSEGQPGDEPIFWGPFPQCSPVETPQQGINGAYSYTSVVGVFISLSEATETAFG